jgi:hypothetical protein
MFNRCVAVRQYLPVLDQESMWIIIGLLLHIPDLPTGHQLPGYCAARPDKLFGRVTGERIWKLVTLQTRTVYLDPLRDVRGDQVIEISGLLEVIVLVFGRFVGQVKRFGDIGLYGLVIRAKIEKILVKSLNMVSQLYRQIALPVGRERLQHFPVVKDMNGLLCPGNRFTIDIADKTGNKNICADQHDAENFDMLKGGVDIFQMCKHGSRFWLRDLIIFITG